MDLLQAQESPDNLGGSRSDVDKPVDKEGRRGGEIERLTSAVARLTSSSVEGLEGLTSQLQELQRFLKAEAERVQGDIDSALAGINIIVETITPWKTAGGSPPSQASMRGVRANGGSRS